MIWLKAPFSFCCSSLFGSGRRRRRSGNSRTFTRAKRVVARLSMGGVLVRPTKGQALEEQQLRFATERFRHQLQQQTDHQRPYSRGRSRQGKKKETEGEPEANGSFCPTKYFPRHSRSAWTPGMARRLGRGNTRPNGLQAKRLPKVFKLRKRPTSEKQLKPGQVLLSDRAGQFAVCNHAGCWVHMERPLRKLAASSAQVEKELQCVQDLHHGGGTGL